MRELIALVARDASPFGLCDREGMIDRLTELEAEAVRTNAPSRTVAAIRGTWRQVWIDSLISKSPGPRGH